MNIKEIVDKIPKKSDVNAAYYSVEERIADVNTEYLKLIEMAGQIDAIFPISDGTPRSETFTITAGDNTLERTIQDVAIERVEYRANSAMHWRCLTRDTDRCVDCFSWNNTRFTANEKQIFLEDAFPGEIQVTYERGNATGFTKADYDATEPPSPKWLPQVFHPLLWMKPAYDAAKIYKPDRAPKLKEDREELMVLFRNHYGREAENVVNLEFDNPENYR